MASTPGLTTPPMEFNIQGGTLEDVTRILNGALNILDFIPATAPYATIGLAVLGIIKAATSRIKSQTGKPIDLAQIPFEQPLP